MSKFNLAIALFNNELTCLPDELGFNMFLRVTGLDMDHQQVGRVLVTGYDEQGRYQCITVKIID